MKKAKGEGKVATGEFGAMMNVDLVNDGPVTITVDSPQGGKKEKKGSGGGGGGRGSGSGDSKKKKKKEKESKGGKEPKAVSREESAASTAAATAATSIAEEVPA